MRVTLLVLRSASVYRSTNFRLACLLHTPLSISLYATLRHLARFGSIAGRIDSPNPQIVKKRRAELYR